MRRLRFDFPQWLWLMFGFCIAGVSLLAAFHILSNEYLALTCPGRIRSTAPLEAKRWSQYDGNLVYVAAFGWLLVAGAGGVVCSVRFRRFAAAFGAVGFATILLAGWWACSNTK